MTAVNTIINNPFHYAGAVVARISVNSATILWAVVVLFFDEALEVTPYYRYMPPYVHEDVWAWFFLTLSSFMLWRILRQHKPHPVGIIGYGILGAAWLFVDVILIFFQRPIYPTSLSWVTVGAALAIYGFVANPKGCTHVADR